MCSYFFNRYNDSNQSIQTIKEREGEHDTKESREMNGNPHLSGMNNLNKEVSNIHKEMYN